MLNNFFYTVQQLERDGTGNEVSTDISRLIGTDCLPEYEKLRFKSNAQLAFAGQSVESEQEADDLQVLYTNFLQLFGTEGVLPQHYSKLLSQRLKQKDYAMSDFLDMFHHRLVSLFYRAWCKYRLAPQYEAHRLSSRQDPVTKLIDAVSGNQNTQSNNQRYYAGHFAKRLRSATNLKTLLMDFLGKPVEIDEFIGTWLTVPDSTLSRLTKRKSQRVKLGSGVFIGRRSWSAQSKIIVRVRELSHDYYQQIMPGSARYKTLQQIISVYTPAHISVEVHFHVTAAAERTCLSKPPQLSRNTWLHTQINDQLIAKTRI